MIHLPPPNALDADQQHPPQDAAEAHATQAEQPEAVEAEATAAPDGDDEAPAAPEATDSCLAIQPEAEKPRKRNNAFTALEIAAQIAQVQEWLTQGKRPNQIRAYCAEEWGLTTRVAESRMQEARRQMVIDVDVYDRKNKAAQMVQQLEQVLEQSIAMRQGSNAIGALRLQADLLQLLRKQSM